MLKIIALKENPFLFPIFYMSILTQYYNRNYNKIEINCTIYNNSIYYGSIEPFAGTGRILMNKLFNEREFHGEMTTVNF